MKLAVVFPSCPVLEPLAWKTASFRVKYGKFLYILAATEVTVVQAAYAAGAAAPGTGVGTWAELQ